MPAKPYWHCVVKNARPAKKNSGADNLRRNKYFFYKVVC